MSDRNASPEIRETFAFRLSRSEREAIREAAERRGWPLSTFIRRAALKAAGQRKAA